jgi:hypothetical protein
MRRDELPDLHYITPIENVPSILTHGILSHNRARRMAHKSVASIEVQERRRRIYVPGGRRLHDYANLYINGRNAMLYRLMMDLPVNDAEELSVLRISCDVLDLPEVVIVDRNAAAETRRFAEAPSGLAMIDSDEVFARYWTHPGDPIAQQSHRQRMCAEVLVPDRIDPRHVVGAYVSCERAQRLLLEFAPGLVANLNADLFFKLRRR